jgi:hypothetical protein
MTTNDQWKRQIETSYGDLQARLQSRFVLRVIAGSYKVLL